MLFNKIYDRINHLILSVQKQNKWFTMLETSNYVNYSRRNPKRSAQCFLSYWKIGILYCTCGHFLHRERGTNQQFISYRMDFHSRSTSSRKEGRPHGHRYGKKPGDKEYFTANQLKKRCKKNISKESMTDSYEIQNSVVEWLKIIETKNFVDDGMLLRMKITLTIWLHKKTLSTRAIGGFYSNKQRSNTIRLTQWPDFKQALSTLHRLQREAEGDPQVPTYSNTSEQWVQSSSSTWWNWKGSWWTHYPSESHDGDAPSIEWTGWLVDCSIWKDSSGQYFLEFNLICNRWIVYSWRRSTVTDGWCKHNTSNDPFSRCKSVQ